MWDIFTIFTILAILFTLFQYFQVMPSFQTLKVIIFNIIFAIIFCFNSKCNPILYFIDVYYHWRIISTFFMVFDDTQNSLEYLIQNINHRVIRILHSRWELIFLHLLLLYDFFIFLHIQFMLRFEKATYLSLLFKSILSEILSNSP